MGATWKRGSNATAVLEQRVCLYRNVGLSRRGCGVQVNEAAQRAAVLRQTVPGQLKEIYVQKLKQLAPRAGAALAGCDDKDAAGAAGATSMETEDGAGGRVEGAGEENAGEGRDGPLTYSPDPQHLREKMADAGSKLPVLRWASCLGGQAPPRTIFTCSPWWAQGEHCTPQAERKSATLLHLNSCELGGSKDSQSRGYDTEEQDWQPTFVAIEAS